jgi:hypothetical protein
VWQELDEIHRATARGMRFNPSQPVVRFKRPVELPLKFFLYLPRLGWLVIYPQYYHVEKAEAPTLSHTHVSRGKK